MMACEPPLAARAKPAGLILSSRVARALRPRHLFRKLPRQRLPGKYPHEPHPPFYNDVEFPIAVASGHTLAVAAAGGFLRVFCADVLSDFCD